MLDRVEFLLNEAFVSLRRNQWMTFAAITTSAMALFIIGGFAFAYMNLARFAGAQESKFEMSVFARTDSTPEQVQRLGDRIGKLDGVKSVEYHSKLEVWQEFQKDNPGIAAGLELDNPMPDTFTVTFTDLGKAAGIAKLVRKMPEVAPGDGVQYMGPVRDLLEKIMNAIRWLGLILGLVMTGTGGILIYNTIRLTMVARRREIRIMELVGATPETVAIPLIIEGVSQGVLGALLATAVLWVAHQLVASLLKVSFDTMHIEAFPLAGATIALCFIGALYGAVCSVLAIRDRTQEALPR